MSNDKKRILFLGDSGTCATGFGQIVRNILPALAEKYEVTQIGINYHGDYYDREKYPYMIYPAYQPATGHNDIFGRDRLLQALTGKDASIQAPFDILFTIQDHFILEPIAKEIKTIQDNYNKSGFVLKWIAYYPIDSKVKENWVTSMLQADYPVLYTNFGKRECMEHAIHREESEKKFDVIYHGINTKEFFPLNAEEIKQQRISYFRDKIPLDTFLIINVNRNQPRKDVFRTMKVFKEFHKFRPQSHLYLHMKIQDIGGSLIEMARELGLEMGKDWSAPENFNENTGFPVEVMNHIYNIADVVITTTLGEGWGLSVTESMQTKTLIVAPDNTSISEIINSKDKENLRGLPVLCGNTSTEFIYDGTDRERLRPLSNIDNFVSQLIYAYDNPDEVEKIQNRAYEWVQKISWKKINNRWLDLFAKVEGEIDKERPELLQKIQVKKDAELKAKTEAEKAKDIGQIKIVQK